MRKTLFVLGAVFGAILVQPLMQAADITISFTNGQNSYTRTVSIPLANELRCNAFPWTTAGSGVKRSPVFPCTTAEVVAAGCVAQPFSAVTKTNLVFRSCTIYTADLAGETAYNSDALYERRLADVEGEKEADYQLSRTAWFAVNQAARDSACAAITRPAGCILVR